MDYLIHIYKKKMFSKKEWLLKHEMDINGDFNMFMYDTTREYIC